MVSFQRTSILAAFTFLSLAECDGRSSTNASPTSQLANSEQAQTYERSSGIAITCVTNGIAGSPSYAINAKSENVISKIRLKDRLMISKVVRFVPNLTKLRYVYIRREFIIFDAKFGACSSTPEIVLNKGCGTIYRPADLDDGLGANLCADPPRPWLTDSVGDPSAAPWNTYRD